MTRPSPLLLFAVLFLAVACGGKEAARRPPPANAAAPLPDEPRALLAYLGDPSPAVRIEAAEKLAALGSGDAVLGLVHLADSDPGEGVRIVAVRALARICGGAAGSRNGRATPEARQAVWGLARALGDASPEVRAAAVGALRRLSPANATAAPALARALADPERAVRFRAAAALGEMGSDLDAAFPVLLSALEDGTVSGGAGGRPPPGFEEPVGGVVIPPGSFAADALGALHAAGSGVVAAMIAAAADEARAPTTRQVLLHALAAWGRAPSEALLPVLGVSLAGSDHELWAEALAIASRAPESFRSVLPTLMRGFHQRPVGERLALVGAAAEQPSGALPLLGRALGDPNVKVRCRALAAIGDRGAGARALLPLVLDAVRNAPLPVRAAAARALGRLHPDREPALDLLRKALGEDLPDTDPGADFRVAVSEALWRIGGKPFAPVPILAVIARRRGEAGLRAIRLLGEMGPIAREAAPVLGTLTRSPEAAVREAAAAALGRIRPR